MLFGAQRIGDSGQIGVVARVVSVEAHAARALRRRHRHKGLDDVHALERGLLSIGMGQGGAAGGPLSQTCHSCSCRGFVAHRLDFL
jgi:hypothetical protein